MIEFIINYYSWIVYILGFISPLLIKLIIDFVSTLYSSNIGNKDKNIEEKRKAYIQLINSMGIFIDGKYKGELYRQAQQSFNIAYDYLWLWGDQHLIQEVDKYLKMAIKLTEIERKNELEQNDKEEKLKLKELMKKGHVKIIILLRKDLGLKTNILSEKDYSFFKLD